MDDTLAELRAIIKAAGFESPAANHASISAYIERNILHSSNSLFKTRAPPLDIILFAIRRLLAPSDAPRLRDIPDLLDFATTIEFYRGLALQKVQEALTFHQYYQVNDDDDDDPATLTEEEVVRLRVYKADDTTLRTLYTEMIMQHCQFDIYHLWTSDPPCATDVTLRLSEYFPDLNPYYEGPSPRLFHNGLSDTEREDLRERGIDSCKFVSDSCAWACEHKLPGQTLAKVFQTPEFAAEYPCKIRVSDLRKSMDFYLEAVERMVDGLHEIFPAN
ncbi:hypothetical protein B0H19DRAFT_1089069 [Mycena capillaripes]|nr:hypothetical protein B0H19DRAFT_1089069 [Mycena capillaripes]